MINTMPTSDRGLQSTTRKNQRTLDQEERYQFQLIKEKMLKNKI